MAPGNDSKAALNRGIAWLTAIGVLGCFFTVVGVTHLNRSQTRCVPGLRQLEKAFHQYHLLHRRN